MAPKIELLFGPMLLGVFFNMILYGVLIVQTYTYYQTYYKKDTLRIKCLVIYLFIVESINTGCDIAIMYQPLIQKFGQPDATKYFPTLFASEPIVIVAVSVPIQIFFAWRVKLLTKSNILAGIITAFSLISAVGGTWTTVKIAQIKLFSRKPELHWTALVWFLAACASDVVITVVLVLTLSKRKTGFVSTDDAISRIIRMTVQTGMLTSIFAIGDVVFFMTLPHTALNFIWDLALSKLYSNCLLSTLNARNTLQEFSGYQSKQLNVASSGARHTETGGPPAPTLDSSVYELHPRKSFETGQLEYGVTVTKVVETRSDLQPLRFHPATQ